MEMRLPTGSSIKRARGCPRAFWLPWSNESNPYSDRGTAIHSFLEDCNKSGVHTALRMAQDSLKQYTEAQQAGTFPPESLDALADKNLAYWAMYSDLRGQCLARVRESNPDAAAICEALDLEYLPIAFGFQAEVAFGFDPVRGTALCLGQIPHRSYPYEAHPTAIFGTADVVALDGEDAVFIGDYKTGGGHDLHTPKAKGNDQLKLLALCAARYYGRSKARVQLIHIGNSGFVWRDEAEFSDLDLDEFAAELRGIYSRLLKSKFADPNAGDHCRYCPAFKHCPTKLAMLREIAARNPVEPEMSAAEVLNAWQWYQQSKAALDAYKEQLDAWVRENPVPMPDGMVLGVRESERKYLDGPKTQAVLTDMFGERIASVGTEVTATNTTVQRAVRQYVTEHKAERLKQKEVLNQFMQKLIDAKGVSVSKVVRVGPYKPDDDAEIPE